MATVAEEIPEVVPAAEAPAKSRRWIVLAVIGLLLLGGAGGAAWWFLRAKPAAAPAAGGAQPAAPKGDPIYMAMSPAFVVNLDDDEAMRYLQVDVQLMSHDARAIDAVKQHEPLIRNNVLLLFGTKRYHDLVTREDKEKLQLEVLAEIRKVLKQQTGAEGIEAVYFTSFIMQ